MTDFPDFQMPAAVAVQVAANGTLLLRGTKNEGSGTGITIPGGGNVTLLSDAPVGQIGYEGQFACYMPASSGTVPFLRANFVWTDSFTGLTVGQRNFFLTCGNGASGVLYYYLAGPVRGDQLTVTVFNLDALVTATLQWGINQTSHVYSADKLIQPLFATTAPNGYTNSAGVPSAGVALNSNPTIPVNSTVLRLAAAYGGRAVFSVNNPATVALTAALIDPVATGAGLYGNANSRYATMNLGASSSQVLRVSLPYGPMLLQLVNTSTTVTITPNCSLVAEDY